MNRFSLEAKVGLLFLACLAIAAYVWFKVFEVSFQEGFLLKAHFRSVEGLVPGHRCKLPVLEWGV